MAPLTISLLLSCPGPEILAIATAALLVAAGREVGATSPNYADVLAVWTERAPPATDEPAGKPIFEKPWRLMSIRSLRVRRSGETGRRHLTEAATERKKA
jgi:hypothetical protein